MANGKCSTCKIVLTADNSNPAVAKRGYGYCRDCRKTRRNEHRKNNPTWAKEDSLRQNRKYHTLSNEDKLQRNLFRNYGISLEVFFQVLKLQDNKCSICRCELKLFVDKSDFRRACLDHDHRTKKIREILCVRCNCLLGYAKDNLEILKTAVAYLKKYEGGGTIKAVPST